jgi:glycosyltransferase involved in cell wall biosynthesis
VRVTLLTNLVPPYRSAVYDALQHSAHLAGGGLRVLCTQRREPQRNWATPAGSYERATLSGLQIPLGENRTLAIPFGVARALSAKPADVLILGGFGIAQWQAQNWALAHDIPTVLQFDGWLGSDAAYANPVRQRLRRTLIARADGFLAASTRGASWFESHGALPQHIRIAPIPPSFPIHAATANRTRSERCYDLLWCGRTTNSKGFDIFVLIAAKLIKAGMAQRIAIAGSTDIPKTTEVLKSVGLDNHADVFDQLPPDDLPPILTNSKIALFPSRNDAYGVGVIDVITCGAVALTSMVTGCAPDVLQPTEILPVDDPQRWVSACERLLAKPELLETTRQQQAKAIANNNPAHHGETIWNAVHDAIKRKTEVRQWG